MGEAERFYQNGGGAGGGGTYGMEAMRRELEASGSLSRDGAMKGDRGECNALLRNSR